MRQIFTVILAVIPLVQGFPSCSFANGGIDCAGKVPLLGSLKPNHFTWQPPGPGDVRSPCPTLNTLANHGFLPHNGRGITVDIVKKAIKDGMNIAEEISTAAFEPALKTNPDPNANFIDLDMLHLHNVIEHDGSLSRRDEYFDPTNPFDGGTFDEFLSYFGNAQSLDVPTLANARARHVLGMSSINPTMNITESDIPRIIGESALMLAVWGSPERPIAKRSYFEYFFRNERLPVLLGWAPNDTPITFPAISQISKDIIAQSPPNVPLTFSPRTGQ